MNEYHQKTCVKFVARDPAKHHDYLWIHPDEGCYSLVGKTGGKQPVSLDSGCIQVGTIVHELMHATRPRQLHRSGVAECDERRRRPV
uniref:Peptidase M12A domain-containing protein n=1 Tax=Caenorhabditis japonica TaxID=281687 RepID=A0A8R1ETS2_CAEJA